MNRNEIIRLLITTPGLGTVAWLIGDAKWWHPWLGMAVCVALLAFHYDSGMKSGMRITKEAYNIKDPFEKEKV